MRVIRFIVLLSLWSLAVPAFILADSQGGTISGDYVETRSAEVYAGPCISNSEVNVAGDQAILSWRINYGSWEGVPLDGLGVIAAVKAKATIGDPDGHPYPAKTVLIVDQRANGEQRRALERFARSQGGELLDNVVSVEAAPIRFEERGHGSVELSGGDMVRIETRPMTEEDHLCGNAELCYKPMTALAHSMPVFSLVNQFTGKGLDVKWRIADKSSAFRGTFSY
jgi:hypothetical protein